LRTLHITHTMPVQNSPLAQKDPEMGRNNNRVCQNELNFGASGAKNNTKHTANKTNTKNKVLDVIQILNHDSIANVLALSNIAIRTVLFNNSYLQAIYPSDIPNIPGIATPQGLITHAKARNMLNWTVHPSNIPSVFYGSQSQFIQAQNEPIANTDGDFDVLIEFVGNVYLLKQLVYRPLGATDPHPQTYTYTFNPVNFMRIMAYHHNVVLMPVILPNTKLQDVVIQNTIECVILGGYHKVLNWKPVQGVSNVPLRAGKLYRAGIRVKKSKYYFYIETEIANAELFWIVHKVVRKKLRTRRMRVQFQGVGYNHRRSTAHSVRHRAKL
jgi:hypothetical protein